MERISASQKTDIENRLLSQFSCPTCTNYILGPVFQCRKGHFFCTDCFRNVCSLCGTKILSRSNVLENIQSIVSFPCRYANRGCQFLGDGGDVRVHQYCCLYSQTSCPLKHIGCRWSGKESEVIHHCNNYHPNNIFQTMSQAFHLRRFNILEEKRVFLLFSAYKYLFRFNWKLDRKRDTFVVAIYFLGTPPLHLMFDYQISFSSKPNPGYYDSSIKVEGPIHKLEDDRCMFMINKYTKLSFEQLCSMCDEEGNLYYTLECEKSFCSTQKSKIIARKGRKQVGSITSAERGTTITIEICFSASGQYMPPMMVFPRKRIDPQLMLNAAPGAWGVCSDSGWMSAELFLGRFRKFIKFSGATVDRPVLLLLDGHRAHTQNIDVIIEARSYWIIILCLPPHTNNKLQVADVAYMRPLIVYYDQQITAWLHSNSGMVRFLVKPLFRLVKWQRQTVFSEIDFALSLTTDIPQTDKLPIAEALQALPETTTSNNGATSPNTLFRTTDASVDPEMITAATSVSAVEIEAGPQPGYSTGASTTKINHSPATPPPVVDSQVMTQCGIEAEPQPGCSTWMSPVKMYQIPTTPPESVFSVISPQQVMPCPATLKMIRVTRKRGKTAIITFSPYKNELEETIYRKKLAEDNKKEKERQKSKKAY
nr:unnamed protein product [Callosobruchus analis]